MNGLQASHYAACAAEGMSEAEIDADWKVTERELAQWHVDRLAQPNKLTVVVRWFKQAFTLTRLRKRWTARR